MDKELPVVGRTNVLRYGEDSHYTILLSFVRGFTSSIVKKPERVEQEWLDRTCPPFGFVPLSVNNDSVAQNSSLAIIQMPSVGVNPERHY